MSSLSDRIALILQTEATSEALAGIINDARAELTAVNEACAAANAKMLDPSSGSAAVSKAKKELDESTLARARLSTAIDHLVVQLEAARVREAEAARSKLYEEAKAERDTLVEDIRQIYPEAAAKIVDLLVRIEAADEKIAAVNKNLPESALWLEYPEQIARGRPPHEGSPLSRSVKLPALLDKETYWNSFWPARRN
jgi:hypothetical protein